MGLHDRTYARDNNSGGFGGGGGDVFGGRGGGRGGLAMPKLTQTVKVLLIINVAVYILQQFLDQPSGLNAGRMSTCFGVTIREFWQIWRYITFQFLHATRDPWHIVMNMLGVYFFGTALERSWGAKKFTFFYLGCGILAGFAYVFIGAIFHLPGNIPIIGASGGVFGILLACAILFPHFRIIFLFFPVPIRLAAVIIFSVMIFVVLRALSSGNTNAAMSDVAHLGGALGAVYVLWVRPGVVRSANASSAKRQQGAWERKIKKQQQLQTRIDAVLDKIRHDGINSLTGGEKKILKDATELQRKEDARIDKLR